MSKRLLILLMIIMSIGLVRGEKLNIIAIGDSITQGGRLGRNEYTYRWPLFCRLVDEGIDFDFIGSRDFGLNDGFRWPEGYKGHKFDPDHEGYYGIKTADALTRLKTAQSNWTDAPDIALIHLGTNDQNATDYEKAVKDPMREIIQLLRCKNPDVVIVLSHLNFNDSPGAFRIDACISELRKEMDSEDSPVILVHMYQRWNENPESLNSDTFDWAHPNERGQKKMAEQWYNAIKQYLVGK